MSASSGFGYVGLPLALLFEEVGFAVVGFDTDTEETQGVTAGSPTSGHLGRERVAAAFSRGRITATSDFDRLAACDAIVICVPTPLGKHRDPDLSYVRSTAEEWRVGCARASSIVLESTTYPGTTRRNCCLPFVAAGGLPAAAATSSRLLSRGRIPATSSSRRRTSRRSSAELIHRPSAPRSPSTGGGRHGRVRFFAEVAESAKLLENIFRAVNIALVNEMKVDSATAMGIDVWEVIDAARDQAVLASCPSIPVPGLGGHCIPLDPFYLAWKAAEHGLWARFIEAARARSTLPCPDMSSRRLSRR